MKAGGIAAADSGDLTRCLCSPITARSPGNKRVRRLFPVTSDGANAVPCSEVIDLEIEKTELGATFGLVVRSDLGD